MDELDLGVLLQNEIDEDWMVSNTNRLSAKISLRESSLLQLVEVLGPVLTNEKSQVRCAGLLLLTSTIENIQEDFLQHDEIGLLVNFYTDRLKDHHSSIPQTLRGLLYLTKASNLTKDNLEVMIDRMFRELMVQQQVVRDRSVVFNIIANILFNRFELAKSLETQITVGLLQAAEGEKDPRNLSLIFRCTSYILDSLNVLHLAEDLFESLAVYFPIDFTPPKGIDASVTKEELVLGLREGLTHPALAGHSIPLFMEKLDSDLESAKMDSADSLSELVRRCALVEGGKEHWTKDNGKLMELVWSGVKKELLGIRVQAAEPVLVNLRQLITKISYFVELSVGGLSTPEWAGSWTTWWGWVWKDTKVHLPNPGTRLIAASIDILAAVAGSGQVQSEAVLSSCIPKLMDSWTAASQDARKQLLSSVDQLLASAAQTGLQVDSENLVGFSGLVGLYLETGHLTGLARAAGLLNDKHRVELCESLISQVESGYPCGQALVHLSKWDSEVVEKKMVPCFLKLGDKGLSPLADLMEAGLLPHSLPSVAERIVRKEYSSAAIQEYLRKLAAYTLTQNDRKCLTNDVGHILKNLLSWSDRPTLIDNKQTSGSQKLTDTGDKDHFCQVLKKLSSLIGSREVLTDLAVLDRLSDHNNAGDLLEAETLISSLPRSILELSPQIVEKVLTLESSWELKGSLVNKLPALADQLSQTNNPQGVGRVCHALVLSGDKRSTDWIQKLVLLLQDEEKGFEAASCFVYLLSPAPWLHPCTSLLYKQRAWAALHTDLLTAAKSPENIHHLTALVSLLPQVPLPLLEPVVPSLLPLVTRALGQGTTAPPALTCLAQLLQSSPTIIHSHIHDIVPRCLKLCTPPSPLNTRLQAIVCLNELGGVSNPSTVSLADSVTEGLADPVKDHKRLVRQEATKARNRWFLITQP